MGCRVRWSDKFGAYFGRKFTIAMLIMTSLCMVISLAVTLTARLYLKSYYCGAHMAGLSFFITLIVLSHHLFKLNRVLICSLRPYFIVQTILNLWGCLCCLAAAICYTMLTATMTNVNYDYVTALVFGWVDAILMFYLLVLSLGTLFSSGHSSYNIGEAGRDLAMYSINSDDRVKRLNKMLDVYDSDLLPDGSLCKPDSKTGSKSSIMTSSTSDDVTCCRRCGAVIFGLIYTLFHLIFALILFLSAYHPASVYDDVTHVSNTSELYTVHVEGHNKMALFLRCDGNGTDTIVYENGLGGLAMMEWDFMPRYLKDRYRVCVHDRRGYGWSEGHTWDVIDAESQWAENNVKFFRALVDAANIHTPFYYAGHSYGGIHLAYTAHLYPDLVKGLIFLDTAEFSPVVNLFDLLPVINNLKPLGLLHIAFTSGLLDYKEIFGDIVNFDHVTAETSRTLVASMRSGYYTEATQTELAGFVETEYDGNTYSSMPAARINEALSNDVIDTPILVIDAGSPRTYFSVDFFSKYEDIFHFGVPGSDHQSLIYDVPYSYTVADLTHTFIRFTNGEIDRSEYNHTVLNMTGAVMRNYFEPLPPIN